MIVSLLQVYAFLATAAIMGVGFRPLGYVAMLPALVIAGLMLGALGWSLLALAVFIAAAVIAYDPRRGTAGRHMG